MNFQPVIFDKSKDNNDIFSHNDSTILLNNIKIDNVNINVEKLYETSSMKKR